MRSYLWVATAALCVSGLAAHASPITYTLTGNFSGSLGATSFTDDAATFTFVGDTSGITPIAGGLFYQNLDGVGTVSITGIGMATFTSPSFGVVSEPGLDGSVGFEDGDFSVGIFDFNNPDLETYGLTAPFLDTSFFTEGIFGPSTPEATTAGDLYITDGDYQDRATTFQAIGITPEPSSFLLLATGLLGACGVVRKRLS